MRLVRLLRLALGLRLNPVPIVRQVLGLRSLRILRVLTLLGDVLRLAWALRLSLPLNPLSRFENLSGRYSSGIIRLVRNTRYPALGRVRNRLRSRNNTIR